MLALQCRKSILRYTLVRLTAGRFSRMATGPGSFVSLSNVPEFKLPTSHWARVRPILSGICGSDLSILSGRGSIYLSAFTSFPFVLGHEVVGEVVERGPSVTRVAVGQRVALEPALGCDVRGIQEICRPCAEGHYANCERVTTGDIGAGLVTGYCHDTGGGWSYDLVAHESQLHPVPEGMPNEAAVLAEPLSCALHGALQAQLDPGCRVLVVGCGTMGLLTLASLKAVSPKCDTVMVAKYPHQRELAQELGVDHLVAAGSQAYQELTRLSGGSLHPLPMGKPAVTGGFDVTFECAGTASSLEDAVRWTRPQGQLVMVGMPGSDKLDLAPLWYQELHVKGAYCYAMETVDGKRLRTFEMALDLLSQERWAKTLGRLVRHRFPLKSYRKAIATAMNPGRFGAVKTVFDMRDTTSGPAQV